MGEKIRSFIAIRLPETVLRAIAKTQDALRRSDLSIRWVRKEGIHLTLKFLGDVERDRVERIRAAMEDGVVGVSPFCLKGAGVGVFPDLRRPRVVWVGLSGDTGPLLDLQRRLETRLEAVGFPKDKRSFKGHLTLGRVKGRLDKFELKTALDQLGGFETEDFTVETVVLFQSVLRPQGAVYTTLGEVALGRT